MPNSKPTIIIMEYYKEIFLELHEEMKNKETSCDSFVSRLRNVFWENKIGKFLYDDIYKYCHKYIEILEDNLRGILSQQSIAYWIHVYRRLAPYSIGNDKRPTTIFITRSILEAAFQKYGKSLMCNKIGYSASEDIKYILKGRLVLSPSKRMLDKDKAERFNWLINHLKEQNQIVLLDFGVEELIEIYTAERLAYEIWDTTAILRSLGKGAFLEVNIDCNNVNLSTDLPDRLRKLIKIYDSRKGDFNTTSSAMVFDPSKYENKRPVLLPKYNVFHIGMSEMNEIFKKVFGIESISPDSQIYNFIWGPFDLVPYYFENISYCEWFQDKFNVSLESVIGVLYLLIFNLHLEWQDNPISVPRYFQRGYWGIRNVSNLIDELENSKHVLGEIFSEEFLDKVDIDNGYEWWLHNDSSRNNIDLRWPISYSIIIPCNDCEVIIDYAYAMHRLHYLFTYAYVSGHDDKGPALEDYINVATPPLQYKECKCNSAEETKKEEIDASFSIGNVIVIAECVAKKSKIEYEFGDPREINNRTQDIVISKLDQVDRKAKWLSKNPQGDNYNITMFSKIFPVVISPFKEYIHSLDPHFWITDELPRILTPIELKEAIENGHLESAVNTNKNVIEINT